MKCRSCSSEIDDKAIVCYRCGAPTAGPATRDAGKRTAPARWWVWAVAVLLVLALLAYVFLFRPGGWYRHVAGTSQRWAGQNR